MQRQEEGLGCLDVSGRRTSRYTHTLKRATHQCGVARLAGAVFQHTPGTGRDYNVLPRRQRHRVGLILAVRADAGRRNKLVGVGARVGAQHGHAKVDVGLGVHAAYVPLVHAEVALVARLREVQDVNGRLDGEVLGSQGGGLPLRRVRCGVDVE